MIIIVNRRARGGRAGAQWDRLSGRIAIPGKVIAADSPQAATRALAEALTPATRRVIAVGGDGTYHQLINAVMARHLAQQLELALVPIGTGSDLAGALGLPARPEQALELAVQGEARAMDLLAVSLGDALRYAVNAASFGLSAAVAAQMRDSNPRRWSYGLAAMRQLMAGTPRPLEVARDGRHWYAGNAWMLVAANGPRFGGGMRIAPNARLDDGRMECILLRGSPAWQILPQLPLLYAGAHLYSPDILHGRAEVLDIDAISTEHWLAELDGEPYRALRGWIGVVPGAVRMVA